MQDRPPVPRQWVEQSGGAPLPRRPAPPGAGIGAGSEPQPPAGRHGRQPAKNQPQPRCQQAAKEPADGGDGEDGGGPPGNGPGPGRPLGRPQPLPGRLGGAAWAAHAGLDPHRHHRPIADGAGQQLVGVVAQVGQDGLQVSLAERPHRPTRSILIIVEGPRSRTGHRVLLPGGASRRPAPGRAGHAARQIAAG